MKFCQTATLWISNCATSWNFKLRLSEKYYTNSHETNCSNSPIGTAFRRGIIHICKLFHCKAYFDKPQTATLNYIFRWARVISNFLVDIPMCDFLPTKWGNMFSSQSSEHCQSKFFKEWHPDYIASYNSLGDPHLRHYFNHPARKNHLTRNHQVSPYTKRFICLGATFLVS